MSSRRLALLLIGTAILSASIGSGITLLAQEGPAGPPGPRGEQGPRGREGFAASEEAGEQAQALAIDLEARVEDLENVNDLLWEEQGYLEDEITDNEQSISEMCLAAELTGCP